MPCRIKAPSVLSPVSFTAPLNHRGPILSLLTAHKQLSRQLRRNRLQCCTAYLLGIGVLGSEMLGGTEKSFQKSTLQCCLKFCLSSSPGLLCLNTASCRAITAHHIRKLRKVRATIIKSDCNACDTRPYAFVLMTLFHCRSIITCDRIVPNCLPQKSRYLESPLQGLRRRHPTLLCQNLEQQWLPRQACSAAPQLSCTALSYKASCPDPWHG